MQTLDSHQKGRPNERTQLVMRTALHLTARPNSSRTKSIQTRSTFGPLVVFSMSLYSRKRHFPRIGRFYDTRNPSDPQEDCSSCSSRIIPYRMRRVKRSWLTLSSKCLISTILEDQVLGTCMRSSLLGALAFNYGRRRHHTPISYHLAPKVLRWKSHAGNLDRPPRDSSIHSQGRPLLINLYMICKLCRVQAVNTSTT